MSESESFEPAKRRANHQNDDVEQEEVTEGEEEEEEEEEELLEEDEGASQFSESQEQQQLGESNRCEGEFFFFQCVFGIKFMFLCFFFFFSENKVTL